MKETIPIEEGDFYWSEEGYRVFTKQYHLKEVIAAKVAVGIVLTDIIQKPFLSSTFTVLRHGF